MKEAEWARAVVAAGPVLLRIARQVVQDEASAEDVVAETYLRAWQKRDELRRRSKLLPWLKRVCRNRALDVRRRRVNDPMSSSQELVEGLNDAVEITAGPPSGRELLEQLPDSLKSIAHMRFVDGMGYSEIAQIKRLPTSTVRGRIYMARETLRREVEMTAEQSEPKVDKWDDGQVAPSPDRVVRWRGMRLRLLGTWRQWQKGFYGPSGRRLSRVPKAVRQSHVFQREEGPQEVDLAQHVLVFFQRAGTDGYAFVDGCRTSSETFPRGLLVYSHLPDPEAARGRRRIVCTVIGPVVEDEGAAVRFRSDFGGECSITTVPGWGAACVFHPQPNEGGKSCKVSVAYSSATVKTDWAVRALLDEDRELDATSMMQVCGDCQEGDITGLALTFRVSPDMLRGAVFRPRWHAKVDWGVISMPPAPAAGES